MHGHHQSAALTLLCCTLTLAGCGDDTEAGPTTPSAAAVGAQLEAIGSQQWVTGVAFITPPDDPNENKQRVSFSAVRRRDGSVRGQLKLSSTQNFGADPDSVHGLRFHARITCLAIEGSTARLGGFVTRSFHPFVSEGEPWTMMVVDRDDGASGRDLTSDLALRLFPNDVEEFCSGNGEPGALVEIERGNIHVRP